MSSPKLYLIKIRDGSVLEITGYRELLDVQNAWLNFNTMDLTGIIHCCFMRPLIDANIDLPQKAEGKLLVSESLKWSLPDSFGLAQYPEYTVKLDGRLIPCYTAINGWGYEMDDVSTPANHKHNIDIIESRSVGSEGKFTIVQAAAKVLKEAGRPLNKEEIYALIVENGLFSFGARKPVSILSVQLNCHSEGADYERAANNPIFGKTETGRFYLLEHGMVKVTGWLRNLATVSPGLFEQLNDFDISGDEDYLDVRERLDTELRNKLDLKRYNFLQNNIDPLDLHQFLKIAPGCLLECYTEEVGFSVRTKNVLMREGIKKVKDIKDYSMEDIATFRNIGKKSIHDIIATLVKKADKLTETGGVISNNKNMHGTLDAGTVYSDSESIADKIGQISLLEHLDRTLSALNDTDRFIIRSRLGYKGKEQTLQEIADKLDLTRERVRQRQNKYIKKIIKEESWDDVIGLRIGQLLINRKEPLVLELLEIEDTWFEGFIEKYTYLANIIQMFSENAIQVIKVENRKIVTRIKQDEWDRLIRELKVTLKIKAEEGGWTRRDINQLFESNLANYSAQELTPLLLRLFDEYLQFEGSDDDSLLLAFGKTAESAVATVLHQAEGPLHHEEIAKRATEILGKDVDTRRALGAVISQGAKLFDRGTYGLPTHNPLSKMKCESIKRMVEHMLYKGAVNKQWHSKEVIEHLQTQLSALPEELDPYILRMIIEDSEKIIYLGRMVWARVDSGLEKGERLEVTDAFIQILQETGHPLTGKELKERLAKIRGVAEDMQIHPNDKLVAVGPNVWGLSEW